MIKILSSILILSTILTACGETTNTDNPPVVNPTCADNILNTKVKVGDTVNQCNEGDLFAYTYTCALNQDGSTKLINKSAESSNKVCPGVKTINYDTAEKVDCEYNGTTLPFIGNDYGNYDSNDVTPIIYSNYNNFVFCGLNGQVCEGNRAGSNGSKEWNGYFPSITCENEENTPSLMCVNGKWNDAILTAQSGNTSVIYAASTNAKSCD